MEKIFRIKLPNAATDWSGVLEQQLLKKLTARMTPRSWNVEEIVEADQAGWVATANDGATQFGLSLTMPASKASETPAATIEWTLTAEAHVKEADRLGSSLFAAIMLGTSAIFGAFAWHLQAASDSAEMARRVFLSLIAAGLGAFPFGLVLGIWVLRPRATKRSRRSVVPGGSVFMKEVAAAVDEMKTQS